MKTLCIAMIFCLIIFGAFTPVWASVELDAYLPISGDYVTPHFKFSKLVVITYPSGGKLKYLLDGQNKTVSFTENSDENTSVKKLMNDINSQHAIGTQALTTMTHLQVNYQTRVTGGPYYADIAYSVTLIPTLANYVLSKGQGESPTFLDASWIAFDEREPVIIPTKYGDLEINYLINFIKSQLSDAYNVIKGTNAEIALQQNLIDSNPLLTNRLDIWNTIYDPTYTLTPTAPKGEAGNTAAVTTFVTGLSGFEKRDKRIGGAEFISDNDYHLDISEQQNTGSINVEEHATVHSILGKWVFSTMQITSCCPSPLHWYDDMPGWIWIGVGTSVIVVIGLLVFYFSRFKLNK